MFRLYEGRVVPLDHQCSKLFEGFVDTPKRLVFTNIKIGAPSRIRTYVTEVQARYIRPLYDQCLAHDLGLGPRTVSLTGSRSTLELVVNKNLGNRRGRSMKEGLEPCSPVLSKEPAHCGYPHVAGIEVPENYGTKTKNYLLGNKRRKVFFGATITLNRDGPGPWIRTTTRSLTEK